MHAEESKGVMDLENGISQAGKLNFMCNICGAPSSFFAQQMLREMASCPNCGSTPRLRAVVHCLSIALFGDSIPLPEFPLSRDIIGMGMSDWEGYARILANKMSYTNTYYDCEPKFDITCIVESDWKSVHFVVSTEVFEHVAPPISFAFGNVAQILKPDGFMIVTVPYFQIPENIEYFPELYEFELVTRDGKPVLINRTEDGRTQEFSDLTFHGGIGNTLEMRLFSEQALIDGLKSAGFEDVCLMSEPFFDYGIFWHDGAWPIIARKASIGFEVEGWGPPDTHLGESINEQPDGRSSFWIKVSKILFSLKIDVMFGGQKVEELSVGENLISGIIPDEVLNKPGRYALCFMVEGQTRPYHIGFFYVRPKS